MLHGSITGEQSAANQSVVSRSRDRDHTARLLLCIVEFGAKVGHRGPAVGFRVLSTILIDFPFDFSSDNIEREKGQSPGRYGILPYGMSPRDIMQAR